MSITTGKLPSRITKKLLII